MEQEEPVACPDLRLLDRYLWRQQEGGAELGLAALHVADVTMRTVEDAVAVQASTMRAIVVPGPGQCAAAPRIVGVRVLDHAVGEDALPAPIFMRQASLGQPGRLFTAAQAAAISSLLGPAGRGSRAEIGRSPACAEQARRRSTRRSSRTLVPSAAGHVQRSPISPDQVRSSNTHGDSRRSRPGAVSWRILLSPARSDEAAGDLARSRRSRPRGTGRMSVFWAMCLPPATILLVAGEGGNGSRERWGDLRRDRARRGRAAPEEVSKRCA